MPAARIATVVTPLILSSLLATGANAATTTYELTGFFSSPGTLDASFAGSVGQPFTLPASFVLSFDVDDSVAGNSSIFFPSTSFPGAASNLSLLIDASPFPIIFWTSPSAEVRQVFAEAPSPQRWIWSSYQGTFSDGLTATGTSSGEPVELSGTSVEIDLVDVARVLYATELASTSLITLDPTKISFGEISLFWSGENDDGDFADFNITGSIQSISPVTAVPAPAAGWLLGTALLGLTARRRWFAGIDRRG